mmetsp:Transcript_23746/g.59022  ORF Transcript_23746/g.59022 Transcript_23746/m.59022 type:complete len:233 (+) Transcript_23746:481-1179(+)
MAGAVAVIFRDAPEREPCQRVEHVSGRVFGEDGALEGEVALEDAGKALDVGRAGVAEVDGPGDVGGAGKVLAAGVEKEGRGGGDETACCRLCVVVDDGAVGTAPRNRREAGIDEARLLRATAVHLRADLKLAQAGACQIILEPRKEVDQREPVQNMRGLQPLHLRRILLRFHQRNRRRRQQDLPPFLLHQFLLLLTKRRRPKQCPTRGRRVQPHPFPPPRGLSQRSIHPLIR